MEEINIENLSIFLDEMSGTDMETGNWGFRGVSSVEYDLIPSIGRKELRQDYDLDLEKVIFERFRQAAIPFVGGYRTATFLGSRSPVIMVSQRDS